MRVLGNLIGMALAYIGLAGCYEPSLRNCSIQCEAADQCIGAQVCLEGYCADSNVLRCEGGQPVIVDANVTDVSTPVDATGLCNQACPNGTCIGGVCTIDCSATDTCDNDITCPANLPCRVICGDSSCAKKIICTAAASCDVDCVGSGSCAEEIECAADRDCDVTCSGQNSCRKKVKCADSCSCDIACTGSGSCVEEPECQGALCRIGNACTSQVAGCNTCQ